MVTYTYDIWLVVAAVFVSFMATFTGLTLTNGISNLAVSKRKVLVVMSAMVLGGGIWSMHFVAMLAMQFPFAISYDARLTLGSVLIAILLVGLALLIMHFRTRSRRNMILAGSLLGCGIVSMHFLGMIGIRGCLPIFDWNGKILALLVAITTGIIAIRTAYGKRTKQNIIAGTIVFGLSVVIVHFVAMYWTGFAVLPASENITPLFDNGTLAIIVMLAAFLICGMFLLSAVTFITPATMEDGSKVITQHPEHYPQTDNQPDPEQNQVKENVEGSTDSHHSTKGSSATKEQKTTVSVRVPFEKNKRIFFISSTEIMAIRAEGHYTFIYNADGRLFCPWSISEAEKRLNPSEFQRTHRSYLVNINHVTSFERRKDNGVCFFETLEHLPSVPVSRTRIEPLRQALGI